MIIAVRYVTETGDVAIVMANGSEHITNAELPPDVEVRRMLAAWRAGGGVIAPFVPPPAPTPDVISGRQFAHGLAKRGLISRPEALAFARAGVIPAALQVLVATIVDAEKRFTAELLISGATQFERAHPLTDTIGAAYGWSAGEIDDFWRECAAL